jgi:hypothetical protein
MPQPTRTQPTRTQPTEVEPTRTRRAWTEPRTECLESRAEVSGYSGVGEPWRRTR